MKVGLTERVRASVREQALSMGRRIDLYLTGNMPDLIDKHDLATKKDALDIERKMDQYEGTLDDLDLWRNDTKERLSSMAKRMETLEIKYGIEKEVKK